MASGCVEDVISCAAGGLPEPLRSAIRYREEIVGFVADHPDLVADTATVGVCVGSGGTACGVAVALNVGLKGTRAALNAEDFGDFAADFGPEVAETALFAIPGARLTEQVLRATVQSPLGRAGVRGFLESPGAICDLVLGCSDRVSERIARDPVGANQAK